MKTLLLLSSMLMCPSLQAAESCYDFERMETVAREAVLGVLQASGHLPTGGGYELKAFPLDSEQYGLVMGFELEAPRESGFYRVSFRPETCHITRMELF